jgi:hypothetical protein
MAVMEWVFGPVDKEKDHVIRLPPGHACARRRHWAVGSHEWYMRVVLTSSVPLDQRDRTFLGLPVPASLCARKGLRRPGPLVAALYAY